MPVVSKDEVKAILAVYESNGRNQTRTAEALGIARSTVQYHLKKAAEWGLSTDSESPVIDTLPANDIPTPDIIEGLKTRFTRRQVHDQAKKWRKVMLPSDLPYAVGLMGDPHVDDNGCHWPALADDCAIMARTPGYYAINLGDSHNNWPWAGRLARLYAEQDTSRETALKLVEWLFRDSGVTWLAIILGNHDLFVGDGDVLEYLGRGAALTTEKWVAQLSLTSPNGRVCRLDARHNHKGTSIYNDLHGQMRHLKFGGGPNIPHIVAGGHIHTWAMFQHEDPLKEGHVWWAVRARGYKVIDNHAERLGFSSQAEGMTITAVINPGARTQAGFVHCFADVGEAADYLTFLRGRTDG